MRTLSIPVSITGYGWSGYTAKTTMSRLPQIGDAIAAAVWRSDKHDLAYVVMARIKLAGEWLLYVEPTEHAYLTESYYRDFVERRLANL